MKIFAEEEDGKRQVLNFLLDYTIALSGSNLLADEETTLAEINSFIRTWLEEKIKKH
jgi:hypothetical protein